MKILILRQKLNNIDFQKLNEGIKIVKDLLPQLDFFFQDTNAVFTSIYNNYQGTVGYVLDNQQILPLVNGDFDIACLIFDADLISPRPTNPTTSLIKKGNIIPMSMSKQWYNNYPNVFAEFFLHELVHAESFRYGVKDLAHDMHSLGSAYSQKQPTEYYTYLLKEIWKNKPAPPATIQKYKYFSPKEIVGLKPELVLLLDKMRGECGFPFIINSGFRTVAQNASSSDSVGDSAHLGGLAVDLSIKDSARRSKLLQVAFNNGIGRIGISSTFVHVDISKSLPQNVVWIY